MSKYRLLFLVCYIFVLVDVASARENPACFGWGTVLFPYTAMRGGTVPNHGWEPERGGDQERDVGIDVCREGGRSRSGLASTGEWSESERASPERGDRADEGCVGWSYRDSLIPAEEWGGCECTDQRREDGIDIDPGPAQ